jgi:hypothetical protein
MLCFARRFGQSLPGTQLLQSSVLRRFGANMHGHRLLLFGIGVHSVFVEECRHMRVEVLRRLRLLDRLLLHAAELRYARLHELELLREVGQVRRFDRNNRAGNPKYYPGDIDRVLYPGKLRP